MKLYGSVQKSNYTFGKWYLELPEIWSRDREYIKNHPYPHVTSMEQKKGSPDVFEFYELEADWMDFSRVFDIRGEIWKDKLLTFIKLFGYGWANKDSITKDTSPLDHLTYLGNYNTLASKNYLWSVFNHGPNFDGTFVEMWYYVNTFEHPENFYTVTKLDSKEFLK